MKTATLLLILIISPLHVNAYSFKNAKETVSHGCNAIHETIAKNSLKISGLGFLAGSTIYYLAKNRLDFLDDVEETPEKLADYLDEVSRLEKAKHFGLVLGFSSLAVLFYLLWQKHYKKPEPVMIKPIENPASQQEKIIDF